MFVYYFTEVRRLSKRNVLVIELQKKLIFFENEKLDNFVNT